MKKNGMIRRIGCLGIVLGIWLCTAAGVRADQDLPGPVPTFELIPAGSYVIPMDTNHQNIGSIFNMKAYGLVNRLLQTNIPVKWAIAAGKTKNTNGVFSAADLTGKVVRIFPSALAESNRAFFSGPFIVHKDFTNAARSIISSYSNNVAVFELTTSVVVDVRYTLTHKPRIAVFNDGGTAAIHADILVEGGFRTNDYQIMQSTNIVLLGATSCFTFASSPHYDGGAAATNQANAVKNFVLSGGNFFGQCAAVRTYENIGKFQSTLGFADDNRAASMQFFNADLPINQFEGRLADEGGSLRDWRLATGSLFTSNSHTYVQNNPLATNSYVSTGGKLHHNAPGSMVFYLGGHEYVGTTIDAINGRRMYLNAIFVPPDRPAACGITFTLDLQIRKSDFPDPVIAGSNLTYTIVATNAGPFGEPMAVVTDTLPAQVTYVSHVVSTGTYNGVTGEWIIGDMPKGASHTLTLTVTVHTNALGLITNKVTIGGVRGDTNPTNNIAFEPTLVLCENVPPTITCPPNVTIQCTASTHPTNTGTAVASDNATVSPAVTFSDSVVTGSCPQNLIITRTWQAVDNCANTSTCQQIITVVDTVPPVVTCPAPVTVQCIGDVPVPNTNLVVASDNCTVNPAKTHVGDTAQTNGCIITITRTYRATDECGNSTDCDQIITVQDTIAPQITCPAPVTVQCIGDVPAPNTNLVVASDNCTVNPAKTHVGDSAQTNGCIITITRTYRATDECGNSTTCTQTITVNDTIPPQITCPAPVTVQCIGDVPAPNTNAVSASDNCTANPAKTHVGDSAVTNGCVITITRTYRATDACGNSTTCTQTITVNDTIPPQITCPAPVTVQCIGDVPAPNTNLVVASDNCTVNPAKTHVGDTAQTNGCVITITRTYRATDECGNSTTCTQTITVNDTIPPQITCPADVTVECLADVPAVNTNAVSASDNCTVNPAKTHVGDTAQTNGCVITITRTYRATDECGNSTTCTQTITVSDTIPPQITCPAPVTVQCIGDVPAPNTNLVVASDNCTVNPAKTHVGDSAMTNGCVITITRTYRATDECGNSTDCDQIITVQDTIAPQITCPADITVECIGDVPAADTDAVSASDNCTVSPVKTHVGDSAMTNGCVITITRTYRATDECGNSTDCDQIITVQDTIAPQITCPADITVECIGDVPAADTDAVSASDNCTVSPVKTHVGDSAMTNGCVITITRTYRATDECGNSTDCDQIITVQDTIAPQITCPADITVECIGDVPAADTDAVSASDNCTVSPVKTHVGDSAQTNGCIITITRTYRATDECGNSTDCDQIITVQDTIPPQITCPAPVTVQCIGDVPAPNTGQVLASDNCTANPIKTHVGDTAVTNGCVITITRTYRATDACGNSTTCTQTITVQDTIPPQITCPAPVTVQCIGDVPAPNTGQVSASDNCTANPAKTHVGDSAVTNGCVITITRTYRATDACGNSTTCTQTITVQDTIPPQITCPAPVTVQCIGDVPAVNTSAVQASDNCGVVGVMHVGDSTPTSLCGGTITRTYRATDACGNSTTCTQIITINDTIPPQIISCPPSVVEVQGNANCQAQVPSLTGQVFATDNCDTNLTITQVPPAGTTFTITTNVTIIVTDDCGNTNASCQITVRTPCNPSFAIEKTLTNVYFEVGSTNLRPPMVGEPLNFVITIMNTGGVNLPTVPVQDVYNTNHLKYVNATPASVDNVNDGLIHWANVGPLPPGASTTIVANFIAVGVATNPGGTNYAIALPTTPPNTPPLPPQTNDEPYVIIPPGVIGDQVWEDDAAFNPPGIPGNGIADENLITAGRNGVTVRLRYVNGGVTTVLSKVTGPGPGGINGYYLFTNLPPGNYQVEVDTTTVPVHPNPFVPRLFTTPTSYALYLGQGQSSLTNDFGYLFQVPTAVDLARFSATRTESGVQVSWTTAVELENLGFNVYRAASLGGERVKLNGALIEGQGTASGQDYGLLDSTAEAGVRYYYWLEDVDWSLKGTFHGPVVVYGDEQGVDRTLAGFEAQREGLYRVSYETLAKAGVNVGAENPAMLQVYVNGSEVAAFVTAYGAPMKQGDFILFYASAPEGEAVEVEIRSGAEEGKRMEELYVAPAEGEGDVWYGVAGQDNRLVFEASEAYVRYLLMGFESGPVWLLDVTDTAATKLLFGYSTLSVNGDVGIYMSYFTEQPARCVAIDPSSVIDVESVNQ